MKVLLQVLLKSYKYLALTKQVKTHRHFYNVFLFQIQELLCFMDKLEKKNIVNEKKQDKN